MVILGIETSCDETSVALVEAYEQKIRLIDQLTSSQIEDHRPFGGIVPEIATRQHLLHLSPLTQKLLARNAISFQQIEGLGITRGPGLASSLMIGLSFGKALALALDRPWVGVNHMEGHIVSAFLAQEKLPQEPHIALIVSGGHTLLIAVNPPFHYEKLGGTLDDAAGEAFDKAAKMLGLHYPGGPEIEKCARLGNPNAVHFPRAMLDQENLHFSFSGLKTSLRTYLTRHPEVLTNSQQKADICASVQQAIVEVLTEKARRACLARGARLLTLSGGVSCNQALRQAVETMCRKEAIQCLLAPPSFSTDNAAMIATAAAPRLLAGQCDPWELDIDPNLRLA